jgi:hypothetical protein
LRVERAEQVPALFLQETVIVAGRDIIEQKVTPAIAAQSAVVRGLNGIPAIYGYNGVEVKPAARTILVTPDGKPILAQWQYGLGRVVAWTSDMQGKWAKDWVTWDQFPQFVGGLVDLLLPPRDTGALTLRTTTNGAQSLLELSANDPQGAPLNDLVIQSRLVAPDGQGNGLRFNQVGPGRYRAIAETDAPGVYLAQIAAVDARGQPVGALTGGLAVSYSLEYSDQRANPQLLQDLATLSNGRFNPLPEAAFAPIAQAVGSVREIGLPLLWLALLLWPLDIAIRRLMLRMSDVAPWLARLLPARTMATPQTSEAMQRLSSAKQRAGRRPLVGDQNAQAPPSAEIADSRPQAPDAPIAPQPATPTAVPAAVPTAPVAPVDPEERMARLLAAKRRARQEREK